MSDAPVHLRKLLGRGDVLAIAFGAMVGWSWVVLAGDDRAGGRGRLHPGVRRRRPDGLAGGAHLRRAVLRPLARGRRDQLHLHRAGTGRCVRLRLDARARLRGGVRVRGGRPADRSQLPGPRLRGRPPLHRGRLGGARELGAGRRGRRVRHRRRQLPRHPLRSLRAASRRRQPPSGGAGVLPAGHGERRHGQPGPLDHELGRGAAGRDHDPLPLRRFRRHPAARRGDRRPVPHHRPHHRAVDRHGAGLVRPRAIDGGPVAGSRHAGRAGAADRRCDERRLRQPVGRARVGGGRRVRHPHELERVLPRRLAAAVRDGPRRDAAGRLRPPAPAARVAGGGGRGADRHHRGRSVLRPARPGVAGRRRLAGDGGGLPAGGRGVSRHPAPVPEPAASVSGRGAVAGRVARSRGHGVLHPALSAGEPVGARVAGGVGDRTPLGGTGRRAGRGDGATGACAERRAAGQADPRRACEPPGNQGRSNDGGTRVA